MSAILAQTAARTTLRATFRATTKRNNSLLSSVRSFGRSFESHPYSRLSAEKSQPGDYPKLARRAVKNFVMYVPI